MDLNDVLELEKKLNSQKPKNAFNKNSIDNTDFNAQISKLVTEGKLPNNEASLTMIRSGLIDLDTAQQRYQQSLQNKVVTNQQGEVNKPADLENIAQNDVRGVDDIVKKGTEQQGWWESAANGVGQWFKKQGENFSSMGSQTGEALIQGIDFLDLMREFGRISPYDKHILKKGLSGFTMGVSEASEALAPNDTSGNKGVDAAGTLMEVSGALLSTALTAGMNLGFKATGAAIANLAQDAFRLKGLQQVAKVAGDKAAAKAAGFAAKKVGLQKAGLSIAKTAGESAVIGLASGAAKGAIESYEDWKDTGTVDWSNPLVSALEEGIAFGTLGAVADPVMGGVSKLLGTRIKPLASEKELVRGKMVGPLFGNPQEQRALLGVAKIADNEAAKQLASKEVVTTDTFKTLIAQEAEGTISEQGLKALNAKRRLDALAPDIAPELKLLANPEFMAKAGKDELARIGKQIFDDPIYATVLEQNPAMAKLVEQGQWDKALFSLRQNLVKTVKSNDTLLEYLQTAYITDVADLNKIVARRVANRTSAKYPNINEGLIKDYLDDPNEVNKIALKQASSPNIFRTLKSKKLLDTRLNGVEANMVVDDLLTKKFNAIEGKVNFENLPDLADLDNITKSAITFSKPLFRTLLKAYSEKATSAFKYFDDKELLPFVQDKMKALNVQDDLLILGNKKIQLNKQIGSIQDQIVRGGIDKTEGLQQIKDLKDELIRTSSATTSRLATLREFENKLTGLTNDQTKKINDFVDNVYRPAASAERLSLDTKDIKAAYAMDNNPYFMQKGSALADTMDAFTVNGIDTRVKHTSFGLDMFKNVWSKWADEFGQRAEPFIQFGEKVQKANSDVIAQEKLIYDRLKATGIGKGTKESALLQRYIEDVAFKTSDEWLSLPVKTRYKVESAAPVISGIYDDLLNGINTTMERLNFPLIEKRSNYVTHFQETQSIWSEIVDYAASGKDNMDDLLKRLPEVDPNSVRFAKKDNKTYFQYAKKRTPGAEFTQDAIGAVMQYTKPALKRIHFSDLVREIDVARQFAPKNFQETLTRFKEDYLLDKHTVFQKELGSKWLDASLNWVRDRMSKGAILYNVNSLFNQITSAPLSVAFNGLDAVKATRYRFTNEGKEALKLSRNLAQRNMANLNDLDSRLVKGVMDKYIPNFIKKPTAAIQGFVRELGETAVQIFDTEAASHAYMTGWLKAKKAGLDDKGAALFADKMVDYIHADVSKIGRPDNRFFQSPLGKALAQFQSFTLNLATTISTELPRMARTEGSSAAVTSLLRGIAAVEIVNAAARANDIPEPYDMGTVLPFGNTMKYGITGLPGFTIDTYKTLVDEKYYDKLQDLATDFNLQDAKKVLPWKKAITLGVTGGGQLVKSMESVEKLLNDEYDNEYDFVRDFTWGPKRIEKAKDKKDEELTWMQKQKLKRKDAVRSKFGLGKKYEFDYAD